ncbi:MAG: MMPL family transporter [Candidatus Onthomonas sp.]|nr:MMPL family transporter [Candidatus Onthomonas sp.]
MLKFGEKIVKLRIPILILSVLLLIPAAIGFFNTRINYDILYYLPDDIDTMQGQDILMDEFGKGAYALFVCEGMEYKDVASLKADLEQVDHVEDVIWYDSVADLSVPVEVLPDSIREVFNSADGDATLMAIFFDTTTSADETMDAIAAIRTLSGEHCFLSSMSAIVTDTKNLVEQEMPVYVIIAALLCCLVLAVTMDSFMIPVLFMLSIGMAIIYNLGTNFIKGEISFITMALVAVLQLGVTMDYSIFLWGSYKEQMGLYPDKKEAMAHAIAATITSVTGSSLTTIAGFIALCFMSFTLGLDLGVVMAKGVVLGVLCCVTVLPSLILVFDKAIWKTAHRTFQLRTGGVSSFVQKHYKLFAIVMLLLWIPAMYGNANYNVYYKLDNSLPDSLPSVQANQVLNEKFDMSSVEMVLCRSDLSQKEVKAMLSEMESVDGINFALGLNSLTGPLVPDKLIPDVAREKLESSGYQLLMISSQYEVATDEVNAQCNELEKIVKSYDPGGMLIGEAPCTRDLITITDHDFMVVSAVSIVAIFVIILLVLRSISLPIILVAVIELAIFINMSLAYYTGTTLPFIASICIGTIQLGATVDYAILMTTRYKRERMEGRSKQEAVQTALSTSIHSVISSALGFFAATIGVGIYSDVDLIGSLCLLMARGAIISMVVVILFLPSMFMLFDKLICKTTLGLRKTVDV